MKKHTLFTIIFVLFSILGNSQNLRAYLSYSIFNTPADEPYVETYLSVLGSSIVYTDNGAGNYQGTIDVQIIFKSGDSIVNYAKYYLSSPVIDDTLGDNVNMLDVQRYSLPVGSYDIEISLKDTNSSKKKLVSYDKFDIAFPNDSMTFSSIELLSSYKKGTEQSPLEKNGYDLTPNVSNYYTQINNTLSFYAELYNSKTVLDNEPFLLTSYIRPFEADKQLDQYIHRKRVKSEPVVVLLNSFDIKDLPSGNYLLVLEARNRNNEVITSKEIFFQRYNPGVDFSLTDLLALNTDNTFAGRIKSKDTLALYIDYLAPISTNTERLYVDNQLDNADVEELRRYFLNFWIERNEMDPEFAWNEYLLLVKQANHNFKAVSIPGYKTDRGRVYLQYGQPNIISEQYFEPAAYPYEVWQYYRLDDQNNKKFVFYTHDLVTGDFLLIHSDAVGELSNYRWETVVYRRTWDPNSLDDAIIPETWGGKATKTYIQPY
jgi:GWxTD domain-containing protein